MTSQQHIEPIDMPRLTLLENKILDGLKTFKDVGEALIEIRECKGYKLRGFETWQSYCQSVFSFSDRHGRRLIQATIAAAKIQELTGEYPKNGNAARALIPIANKPKIIRKMGARLQQLGKTISTASSDEIIKASSFSKPIFKKLDFEDYLRVVERFLDSTKYGAVDHAQRTRAIFSMQQIRKLTGTQ